jgi:methyl-accepting chemotaxis protein
MTNVSTIGKVVLVVTAFWTLALFVALGAQKAAHQRAEADAGAAAKASALTALDQAESALFEARARIAERALEPESGGTGSPPGGLAPVMRRFSEALFAASASHFLDAAALQDLLVDVRSGVESGCLDPAQEARPEATGVMGRGGGGCRPRLDAASKRLEAFRRQLLRAPAAALSAPFPALWSWLAAGSLLGGVFAASMLTLGAGLAIAALRAGVTAPLKRLRLAAAALIGGDAVAAMPLLERTDDVGGLARAIEALRRHLLEQAARERTRDLEQRSVDLDRQAEESKRERSMRDQAQALAGLAAGVRALAVPDFSFRVPEPFAPAHEGLRQEFNAALDVLADWLGGLADVAHAGQAAPIILRRACERLAEQTKAQEGGLAGAAETLKNAARTARGTAEQVLSASNVADKARSEAQRSQAVVREAATALSAIEVSARQIGEIIGVIDEIAFQTSLLALNAGVEAARAGAAGKGFAVVASEVRALASRSAGAAKQIKALVSTSGRQTAVGVSIVGDAGQALGAIVQQVDDLAARIREIAGSAEGQAVDLDQLRAALEAMSRRALETAVLAEESAAASDEMGLERSEILRLAARAQKGDASIRPSPVHRSATPVAARLAQAKAALRSVSVTAPAEAAGLDVVDESWGEF